jgi:hypothetical protein
MYDVPVDFPRASASETRQSEPGRTALPENIRESTLTFNSLPANRQKTEKTGFFLAHKSAERKIPSALQNG